MNPRLRNQLGVILVGGVLVGVMGFRIVAEGFDPAPPTTTLVATEEPEPSDVEPVDTDDDTTTSTTAPTTTTSTLPERQPNTVPGWTVGEPWGTTVGITMFRGNPTRSFYGTGPLPEDPPSVAWRFPESAMCGSSAVGSESRVWCGTGWTGQPSVWERPDGVTEVVFGAYDKAVHFLDAETGERSRPDFPVGDIIKGSVTVDPDGFPLMYTGSRDNKLRVIALDRDEPVELWSLDANVVDGIWNDDWDGNPVIVDDIMYQGGENSWFFAIELNRAYDADGNVTVDPEVVFQMPGWTQELLSQVGQNVSIESSVVVWENRVYFANSGGRIVGMDVTNVREGEAPIVFDFWAGDDIDATMVADVDGSLYVAIEKERFNARSEEVGQLIKLDPFTDGDPIVWSVEVPPVGGGDGGIWASPALAFGHVYVTTHPGELLVVDASTGEVVFRDDVGWHAWSSPVVVDDALLVGTCVPGELRKYSLEDPAAPSLEWTITAAEGCIESTPAVWEGRIYVGSRDGFFRAYAP